MILALETADRAPVYMLISHRPLNLSLQFAMANGEEFRSLTYWLFTILILVAIVFLTQSYLFRREKFSFFNRLGIPGPRPHLITGNCDEIRNSSKVPTDVMDQWQRQYGDIYGYYIGVKPYIVVRDLDLVQRILTKEFHNYVNRPHMGIEIRPVTNTLVGLRGQRWKHVRRTIAPAFSKTKMRVISHIINYCVDILVDDVVASRQDQDMDFHSLFQSLTCQVIGQAALDTQVDCQRNTSDRFLDALRNFLAKANNPIISLAIYFPAVRNLLGQICHIASPLGQFTQSIIDKVQQVIVVRRCMPKSHNVIHRDILQLLLDASENNADASDNTMKNQDCGDEKSDSSNHRKASPNNQCPSMASKYLLTDDEIIANAWVFLLGGFETTANALTYCSYLLATHPDVQDRVYQEILANFQDNDREINLEQSNQLVYLDQVLREALRLYPPVVLFVTREAAEDTKVGQFHIPAGTNVQIPVWQIHHDANIWPDPDRFDPDRFDPELRKTYHPMAWIPFGSGPRGCIGKRFALLEIKIALTRLLINYKLVPCERTEPQLKLNVQTVTLNPKNPVWLRVERRHR